MGQVIINIVKPLSANKVDLTRFAIQTKDPDGKWTRKPLSRVESNNVHLHVTRPPEYVTTLFFMLLAFIQSIDDLFYSFIVLCENEYFLISDLHRSFTNFTSRPLVLLSFLSEKNIFLSIFSYPSNILTISILSPLNFLFSRVLMSCV